MTIWILNMSPNDSFIDKGGSYVDPTAEAWEDEFIDLLVDDSGYKVPLISFVFSIPVHYLTYSY